MTVVRGQARLELGAVCAVWHREMLRFTRDRVQLTLALMQPVLLLVVLGIGLTGVIPHDRLGGSYLTFLFPGVLVMTVVTPALMTGASLVTDREHGILREMLLAPVRRESLLIGKCLGGATVATCQAALLLTLAGLAQIPYHPGVLTQIMLQLTVAALTMASLGTLFAVTITSPQAFQAAVGLAAMPMIFLSGAMFPLTHLPPWLTWTVTVNPISYTVDAVRRITTESLPGPPPALTGLTWAGWHPPILLETAINAALGALLLLIATRRFARPR
ncbi:MAG: ABC transporter permease [Actinomadura sp.]